jgi:hypothetical protein
MFASCVFYVNGDNQIFDEILIVKKMRKRELSKFHEHPSLQLFFFSLLHTKIEFKLKEKEKNQAKKIFMKIL